MQVNAVLLLRKKIISSLLKTLRFSFQNGALSVVPLYVYMLVFTLLSTRVNRIFCDHTTSIPPTRVEGILKRLLIGNH